MKVIFCLGDHYRDFIGGAEVQSILLARELVKKGHSISYICNGDRFGRDNALDEEGIEVYRIKKPFKGVKSLHYLHWRMIYRLLDTIGPEVIYQRGDYHFMDLMGRYGKLRNVPVISGLSMERHCHRPKVRLSPSLPFQLLNTWLIDHYYSSSTVIVCQTRSQQRLLKKNFGVESVVIPIGHPVPEDIYSKETKPTIIWVANIKPIKRPEVFVRLASRLKDTHARFIMIGRPDEGYYQREIDRILQDEKNIEYLGEMDLERTNEWIERSHLLINTSESEGFSNTFVQAWMRRTPVVSMNTDPEGLISREGLGFVEKDEEELASKVRLLLSNPILIDEMANRARKVAYRDFDLNKITTVFEELLLNLGSVHNPINR